MYQAHPLPSTWRTRKTLLPDLTPVPLTLALALERLPAPPMLRPQSGHTQFRMPDIMSELAPDSTPPRYLHLHLHEPEDMLAELRDDSKTLAALVREAHGVCEEHEDIATAVQNSRSRPAVRVTVAVPRSDAHLGQCRTTDYATVLLPLPGISNDLEVVRLL